MRSLSSSFCWSWRLSGVEFLQVVSLFSRGNSGKVGESFPSTRASKKLVSKSSKFHVRNSSLMTDIFVASRNHRLFWIFFATTMRNKKTGAFLIFPYTTALNTCTPCAVGNSTLAICVSRASKCEICLLQSSGKRMLHTLSDEGQKLPAFRAPLSMRARN